MPPMALRVLLPPIAFAAVALVLISGRVDGALARSVYVMSAYALAVTVYAVVRLIGRVRCGYAQNALYRRISSLPQVREYRGSADFRGKVGIGFGIVVNLFHVVFRLASGLYCRSAWFISIAVYYAALVLLRVQLLGSYHGRDENHELRAYRRTARLLFLLNIPMGGMIFQMIRDDASMSYPGFIIYLSAAYTFYAATAAVYRAVKYRGLDAPLLSAAKALGVVSAMMSVLGLQTALLSRFSDDRGYRLMMNGITGTVIWCGVISTAVCMLLRGRRRKRVNE